jgi:Protein of unknown function (DUF4031)
MPLLPHRDIDLRPENLPGVCIAADSRRTTQGGGAMTVYVDNSFIPATVPNGRVEHTSNWCHLFADTPGELHEFAAKLGLKPSYFQGPTREGDPHWHYDVTEGKRWQAVKLGAREVEWRDTPSIMRERDATLTEGRQPRVHGTSPHDKAPTAEEADYTAGVAFKAGEHLRAARLIEETRVKYPDQPGLWADRADAIHSAMRAANPPMQESDRLAEVVGERLTKAGVQPDDPEATHIRAWNEMQHARAFPETEAAPESVPVPELTLDDREATP